MTAVLPKLAPSAEELFRLIVEEAKDVAIFLLDPAGHIISWNEGAKRIFGWSDDDVLNRHFAMLFTPADRAGGVPERELKTARETGRASDTRWHLRSDGRLFFADGVTSMLRDDGGDIIGFSKFARDITERYLTERRLAAQLALTNVLTTELPLEAAARRIMQAICENLGWDIGALWRVADDALRPVDIWNRDDIPRTAADAVTAIGQLASGQGLPGRVWASAQPAWITEVAADDNFPRAKHLMRYGMRSAMAFPITHDATVRGVMEFFSRQIREPEQALLPTMALIGAQIGDYLERRRTAEALRVSEERYRVITEAAHDAIFTIDRDSRILFVNAAVEKMFGYPRSEIVGKALSIIIPERLREAHQRGIERYLRTREKHIPWDGIEMPALHRDGHEFPVELSFGEFHDDSETIFTGYARDITERRRARDELQRLLAEAEAARAQLERRTDEEVSVRHLASALSGAVEMDDVLHEITSRATLVTRADGVYVERIIAPNEDVEVVSAFGRAVPPRGSRMPYPGSLTEEILKSRAPAMMRKETNAEIIVTPLIAEEQALGALILLNSGTSGRHFNDDDLGRARTLGDLASLALRRVRLMEEEREAKEKAEAAVRVRDETLGIVSHDLRNPLTTIALSAELLADSPSGEQREHIQTIRSAAKSMQRLIQDLLDVARVESGRLTIQKVTIDPAEVARRACESHTPIAESKGIRLISEIDDLPHISGDRDRLLQVFGNLIGNALKFTPPGGCIYIRGTRDEKSVIFQVQDTGPGIPDSDLKNVFKPYWQAKKTAHMGAGLGLAIVRGIVDAHGGTVRATNASGGGALFTFTIPLGSGL